jgi:hypothetical protein
MVEEESARAEQRPRSSEELAQLCTGDVLEHPHRGDLVERLLALELAVVDDLDSGAVRDARAFDSIARPRRLLLAERDPDGFRSLALGRVNDEPTPTAADVEQAVAAPEA